MQCWSVKLITETHFSCIFRIVLSLCRGSHPGVWWLTTNNSTWGIFRRSRSRSEEEGRRWAARPGWATSVMPIDTQHPLFYTLKIKCQGYLLSMHNDARISYTESENCHNSGGLEFLWHTIFKASIQSINFTHSSLLKEYMVVRCRLWNLITYYIINW